MYCLYRSLRLWYYCITTWPANDTRDGLEDWEVLDWTDARDAADRMEALDEAEWTEPLEETDRQEEEEDRNELARLRAI